MEIWFNTIAAGALALVATEGRVLTTYYKRDFFNEETIKVPVRHQWQEYI